MTASLATKTPAHTYGRDLGVNFGADEAPCIVTRSLHSAEIAVTELRVDQPLGRLSDPIPREDGYMLCLMLREIPNNVYFEEGRQVSAFSLPAGVTTIHDLKRDPLAVMDKPIHSLLWYLSRATLDALADHANAPRVDELRYQPGVAANDEIIRQISLAVLPALQTPEQVSRLFADHVTMAFAAHAAHAYGGMQSVQRVKGCLAPWQERRSYHCRPERRDIARRCRRGVRLICGLFFASVPENDGSRTSHLATARSRRTRDDHVARNGQEPLRDRASMRFL